MALNLYEMDPRIYDDYIDTKIERINFNKVFDLVKKICDKKESVEILDFCCGTGVFPRKWLIKLNNIKYLGVDINSNFIKFAKKKLKDNRFNFVVDDSVLFKTDKKFDIILATSSYHHIKDNRKRAFLKNIFSHLKKDGILIVYEKIIDTFSNKIEAVDSSTQFYLERIKYMMKTEKLSKNQLFALFNEQYLTAIRHEEYKVNFQYFKDDIEASGMKIKEYIKLWPKKILFHNDKVGDFVFLIVKN
ncbi:MAG: class I SAM-dependent methyltransferase [Patescibacteria group bacterium]|nr:class I SAM-dependent methyltransferase [Patescibacteria group bacterium]